MAHSFGLIIILINERSPISAGPTNHRRKKAYKNRLVRLFSQFPVSLAFLLGSELGETALSVDFSIFCYRWAGMRTADAARKESENNFRSNKELAPNKSGEGWAISICSPPFVHFCFMADLRARAISLQWRQGAGALTHTHRARYTREQTI